MSLKIMFLFFSRQAHVNKWNSMEELLLKVNVLLPLCSYVQPTPLRQPLIIASDSRSSGGSLHAFSSIWYTCTLFHDLSTLDKCYWISNSNCPCLASSILEIQILVIPCQFFQVFFLNKVPQGISTVSPLCSPLFPPPSELVLPSSPSSPSTPAHWFFSTFLPC